MIVHAPSVAPLRRARPEFAHGGRATVPGRRRADKPGIGISWDDDALDRLRVL